MVSVRRLNGFSSAVSLSLEGAPPGVTGRFFPRSASSDLIVSVLEFNLAASTALGTYTLTVRARGDAVDDQIATLTFNVTAAPGTLALTLTGHADRPATRRRDHGNRNTPAPVLQ